MIENLGWLSSSMLMVCGIFQAYTSHKRGNTLGLNDLFIWTCAIGEVSGLLYVCFGLDFDGPMLANYGLNTVIYLYLLKLRYFPRFGDE